MVFISALQFLFLLSVRITSERILLDKTVLLSHTWHCRLPTLLNVSQPVTTHSKQTFEVWICLFYKNNFPSACFFFFAINLYHINICVNANEMYAFK